MGLRLIRSVLVPNRGEIAVRIARACAASFDIAISGGEASAPDHAEELTMQPGEGISVAAVLGSNSKQASRALARREKTSVWDTVGRWGW